MNISFLLSRGILLFFLLVLVSGKPVVNGAEFIIEKPQRLSSWLNSKGFNEESTITSRLSWRVPEEKLTQRQDKYDLLFELVKQQSSGLSNSSRHQKLYDWLKKIKVTGRVSLPNLDARWLQVNPQFDPILKPHQSIYIPESLINYVTVLSEDGIPCYHEFGFGKYTLEYIKSCQKKGYKSYEVAWLIQPNGDVSKVGIRSWNSSRQNFPSKGAIIWAPSSNFAMPSDFSERLAKFLSTQSYELTADFEIGELRQWDQNSEVNLSQRKKNGTGFVVREPRDYEYTPSNWGVTGLLQVPSARFAQRGKLTMSVNETFPYQKYNLILHPYDWLEGGFRYTNIRNRLYGSPSFSGSQNYKDKSFEAKIRLVKETNFWPQIALGIRDPGGNGLFSSEYLVGSKRFFNFDWTLGMAWGNMGASGDYRNPLGLISNKFDYRPETDGAMSVTGKANLTSHFRGRASLIGGVEYHLNDYPITLKLEFEGNDYQSEGKQNNQRQRTRLNLGFTYQVYPSIGFSAGWERGDRAMFGVAFTPRLNNREFPKPMDPPKVSITPVDGKKPSMVGVNLSDEVIKELQLQTFWQVVNLEPVDSELRIYIEKSRTREWRKNADRGARLLHNNIDPKIKKFVFVDQQLGVDIAEYVVDRRDWLTKQLEFAPALDPSRVLYSREPSNRGEDSSQYTDLNPLKLKLGTNFAQTLGGPDGFQLFRFSLQARATLRLSSNTWAFGKGQLGIFDTYDKYRLKGKSHLPPVRTDLREYATASEVTMPSLFLQHNGKLSQDIYYSFLGGYLEWMFGGVGGEILYRPWKSRLALGLDIFKVNQRDFRQDFGFREYDTTTGHLTAYWDTGFEGLHFELSAGRYLARDKGVTLGVKRAFRNGAVMGAWATRTNVSAEEFGEGAFDKGIFFKVPFNAFLPKTSSGIGNFSWRPLTRDGGAKLNRPNLLYDLTYQRGVEPLH